MNNTKQSESAYSGFFTPSAESLARYDGAMNRHNGEQILKTLGAGVGVGAGATALYHLFNRLRAPAEKEKKYVGYGSGSPLPAKTAFDVNSITESIGGMLPKTLIPGGEAPAGPTGMQRAWGTAATLGAGGLGLYGGKKLIDMLAQKKKKQDLDGDLEAAKKDYYSALAGDKSAAALDTAFEKSADMGLIGDIGSAVASAPQAARTAYLLAMLGAGGVGAKYMYDRTKARTDGENLAKAQASRARTKGLPTVWVDPQSLTDVKSLAGSHE